MHSGRRQAIRICVGLLERCKSIAGPPIILCMIAGIGILPMAQAVRQDVIEGTEAPPNPEFAVYLELAQSGNPRAQAVAGETSLGHIPPATNWAGQSTSGWPALPKPCNGQPAAYDLRTYGRVPPVRSQGGCGSCWAFATMASVESYLLTIGQSYNLSENNVKECHLYNWTPCAGGNRELSTGYLARRAGPVSETDDPYVASEQFVCQADLTRQTHLDEVWQIPQGDTNGVKDTIISHGALYTCFYWNNAYYDSENFAYYYAGTEPGGPADTNHCVAIVGWDDGFGAEQFASTPPGDGAWLLRNSWGTGWHDNGYFWMSYYDQYAAAYVTMFDATSAPSGDTYYEYDPLGANSSFGYGSTTAWGANVFTATGAGQLHRVQFYTTDVNATYGIYYKSGDLSGGVLNYLEGGSCAYPGFHTVDLTTPVSVANGERFTVAIRCTNSTDIWPVAIEQRYAGYSDAAAAGAGESFGSSNGESWSDITSWAWASNANVAIKAAVEPMGSSDTAAVFRVDHSGNVSMDGTLHSSTVQSGAADVAEWVAVSESVEPGDVLELDPSRTGQYRKSRRTCSPYVAGVVSTEPGVVLGSAATDHSSLITDSSKALLALVGIVPIKVCDEGGAIEPGDLLSTASRPGYAKRSTPEACTFFVGKALEPLDEREGLILALLMR